MGGELPGVCCHGPAPRALRALPRRVRWAVRPGAAGVVCLCVCVRTQTGCVDMRGCPGSIDKGKGAMPIGQNVLVEICSAPLLLYVQSEGSTWVMKITWLGAANSTLRAALPQRQDRTDVPV